MPVRNTADISLIFSLRRLDDIVYVINLAIVSLILGQRRVIYITRLWTKARYSIR